MSKFLGTYDFTSAPFDWGPDYKLPSIPEVKLKNGILPKKFVSLCTEPSFYDLVFFVQTDLVIYEMNVRAFTADGSGGLDPEICGSYLGVIEKVGSYIW